MAAALFVGAGLVGVTAPGERNRAVTRQLQDLADAIHIPIQAQTGVQNARKAIVAQRDLRGIPGTYNVLGAYVGNDTIFIDPRAARLEPNTVYNNILALFNGNQRDGSGVLIHEMVHQGIDLYARENGTWLELTSETGIKVNSYMMASSEEQEKMLSEDMKGLTQAKLIASMHESLVSILQSGDYEARRNPNLLEGLVPESAHEFMMYDSGQAWRVTYPLAFEIINEFGDKGKFYVMDTPVTFDNLESYVATAREALSAGN